MIKIINSFKVGLNLVIEYIWNRLLPLILCTEVIFACIWRKKTKHLHKSNNNIIIIGGGLRNKGAQAMTFTVVDQMKRIFPNKMIYLFSKPDFKRKVNYYFKILPWNTKFQIKLSSFWHKFLSVRDRYDYLENEILEVIKNADFMVDISGDRFTSMKFWLKRQEDWFLYLFNIIIAKKYSIPYYIFAQSIGPFNFPLKQRIFFYPLTQLYFKYPKKVFVRENDGIRYTSQFKKVNAEKTYDIVLQNKEYNLSNIFKKNINLKDFQIASNSVCIIPSKRIKLANPNKTYLIYYSLIKRLIEAKKSIYILRHSFGDLKMCKEIKNLFPTNENVILIPDDLNVIELEMIIKKFDFIIASRYHSIVHAYKNGIPALVIGWAIKYFELLKLFDQSDDYHFDIRDINVEKLNEKLELMIRNYENEKKKISAILFTILKKKTCFDVFKSYH